MVFVPKAFGTSRGRAREGAGPLSLGGYGGKFWLSRVSEKQSEALLG